MSCNLSYIKTIMLAGAAFVSLMSLGGQAVAADIEMDTALLRTLDKVTGRTNTVEAAVGSEFVLGTLTVKVNVCKTRPPEETPENSVFLEIVDNPLQGETAQIFSGWMFSSSPALSALDNPVYDIWLLKCTGKKALPGKTSPKPLVRTEKPEVEANPIVKIDTYAPVVEEMPASEEKKEDEEAEKADKTEEKDKKSFFPWF